MKPVSFWEAVKAGMGGKKIKLEHWDKSVSLIEALNCGNRLDEYRIAGKWQIEPEEIIIWGGL